MKETLANEIEAESFQKVHVDHIKVESPLKEDSSGEIKREPLSKEDSVDHLKVEFFTKEDSSKQIKRAASMNE